MSYKRGLQTMVSVLLILLMIAGCTKPMQENATVDVPYADQQELKQDEHANFKEETALNPSEELSQEEQTSASEESIGTDSTKEELGTVQGEKDVSENTEGLTVGGSLFFSVEELLKAAAGGTENLVQATNNPDWENTLGENYNHFYVPALLPANYVIEGINVSKTEITYYYQPSDVPYSYKNLIKFIYKNPDQVTTENPLDMLVARDKTDVTEDGLLYLPHYREISFTVGDSWMSIIAPESMNTYEQMKALCVATRYEVNTNSNTVTE